MPGPSATFALGPFPDAAGFTEALALDAADPLASHRSTFVHADPDLLYLDGNSLGRLPEATLGHLERVVRHEWGERLIRSWDDGWWSLAERVGARLAPIVGADVDEMLMSESTSVNLFKLAGAALAARRGRTRILTDDLNFPTDLYVLGSAASAVGAGHEIEVVPSPDGIHGPTEAIEAAIDDDTALVSLSHVTFKSGFAYDLARITAAAHRRGALVLWDLSHSVGSVPIELDQAGADLAVGCTYKYLNGGPGSPAFLFVRKDLQDRLDNPIAGWWGHVDPFAFDLDFAPAQGIRRFHTSTMPIVSLAAAEVGIRAVADVGIEPIREKSVALVAFAEDQFDVHLAARGFSWASPVDPARRGSHVSLSHPDAWRITQAYKELGKVIPDFRSPDNLRLGFAPLYNSFVDVHTAMQRLCRVVEGGHHEGYPAERTGVS